MTTALDLITRAARLLGVARKGEALDADEAADGLEALNDMLASWSNSSLSIYARTLESFTLASGALSYTMGSSQTLNTAKPIKIVHASMRSGSVDYDLSIVSEEEFEGIAIKSIQGSPGRFLTYDNGDPYITLRIYPVPNTGDILRLLSEKALTNFAALSTTVTLPAGSNRAIASNLALDMAPEYGVQASPEVVKMAMDSKGAIKLGVARNRPMPLLNDTIQKPNIYTGFY